jgi:hypothetical protein
MRGKRAKLLRRQAKAYVLYQLKKPLGEGYNTYHQVENRMSMEPVLDDDGFPRQDEDGTPLLGIKKKPGTITTGWHFRTIYKILKKAHYGRHRSA